MLEGFLGSVLVPRRYSRYLVLGCCLGVAAILVVLSLFANYFRAVETQLLGIHPHLSVHPAQPDGVLGPDQLRRLGAAVADLEGVVTAGPAIDRIVRFRLASVETHSVACRDRAEQSTCFDPATALDSDQVRGSTGFEVDRAKSVRVRLRGIEVPSSAVSGSGNDPEPILPTIELERVLDVRAEGLDLARLAKGPDEGMPMAAYFERRLFHGASSLDDFLLLAPTEDGSGRIEDADLHHLRLLSTLHLGLRQDAHPLIVTSIGNAMDLLGSGAAADTFEVRLGEPRRAAELAPILAQRLETDGAGSPKLGVRSWLDRDEGALRLLKVLRWVIFVVASSVMVVAALGVMSTLSLVILEGRQKIAMMRAMGLRDRNLYLALALECLRIAALGLGSGIALGAAASWALLRIPGFHRGLYKMGVLAPEVMLQGTDLFAVALATFLLFLLVAFWPARQACRIHPVTGLRG